MDDFRTGFGWDVHALVPDRPLVLCGVRIPYEKGLLGHSDADAPIHALIDALLGAVAAGDIGQRFPDTDPAFKDADSALLLQAVLRLPELSDWRIVNADLTIVAQAPKLAPGVPAMRERLAELLSVGVDRVSVKAKTAEKMGPAGEGRAIEAFASVLICKKG